MEGEEQGGRREPAPDEGEAPGRAAGGPEERGQVLGETRGGHAPTLGARCGGGRWPQLEVDEELVDEELVEEDVEVLEESEELEEPELVEESPAPAGVDELVLLEELSAARESLR